MHKTVTSQSSDGAHVDDFDDGKEEMEVGWWMMENSKTKIHAKKNLSHVSFTSTFYGARVLLWALRLFSGSGENVDNLWFHKCPLNMKGTSRIQ